jgi:hypothetical protein
LSEERASEVLEQLQKNVYRSFAYREEDAIYDALAKSVDGPLLKRLYLEVRRGLEMQEQGGAVSRIREMEIVEGKKLPHSDGATVEDERGFAYESRWTVAGTVEHWGHIHSRTNAYQARFLVEPRGAAWKITDMEIKDEQRVSFETTVRGL